MSNTLMPAIFVGHGSPMNVLDGTGCNQTFRQMGERFQPAAILAISAHWMTDGVKLQNAPRQKTIYDFYGFPEELYGLKYPAQGANWLADELKNLLTTYLPTEVMDWGLDHGTWAVLYHMYPQADIPVIQLSLNRRLSYQEHYQLGAELRALRSQGVMILASGNIVHNLREIDWQDSKASASWAVDFDHQVKGMIENRDHRGLVDLKQSAAELFRRAHPTDDHYIPLLYALGASLTDDRLEFPIEEMQNGTISMRSVLFY